MSQDQNNFNQQQQPQVVINQTQPQIIVQESQTLAAVISFFFGGFGQLVQGRVAACLLWICVYILGVISTVITFGLGGIFLFIAWILCIVDAAKYKPGISAPVGNLVIVGLVLNSIVFIIAIVFFGLLVGGAAVGGM